jgi:D-alanyl-lipoteichoic acid acyltransferase DltB (MBOAT superfamily)
MSLSFWLRDYLYIPLGGNRGGTLFVCRNLMITMLLGGLWHGAAWNYVIWGGLHGTALCVNKLWAQLKPRLSIVSEDSVPWIVAAVVLTQLWVMIAWVFFRCNGAAQSFEVLAAISGLRAHPGLAVQPVEGYILAIIAIDHVVGSARFRSFQTLGPARPLVWGGLGVLMALALSAAPLVQKPFIYFQF